jgi:hypothetical protein
MNYYKNLINCVWLYFKNMYMNMDIHINSDIENQVSKKEKCISFMEKHSLCVVGCWLVFMLIMSISISEYYKNKNK